MIHQYLLLMHLFCIYFYPFVFNFPLIFELFFLFLLHSPFSLSLFLYLPPNNSDDRYTPLIREKCSFGKWKILLSKHRQGKAKGKAEANLQTDYLKNKRIPAPNPHPPSPPGEADMQTWPNFRVFFYFSTCIAECACADILDATFSNTELSCFVWIKPKDF
jgi:hypothetical protein